MSKLFSVRMLKGSVNSGSFAIGPPETSLNHMTSEPVGIASSTVAGSSTSGLRKPITAAE